VGHPHAGDLFEEFRRLVTALADAKMDSVPLVATGVEPLTDPEDAFWAAWTAIESAA